MLICAENPIRAAVGDMVTISTSSSAVLLSAVVLYMIPVILFFVGFWVGLRLAFFKELMGCIGFMLGIAFAVTYDRKVLVKRKINYTITGFAQNIELEG